MTIKKRNTCCDKRSITTYRLDEIEDIRAVYRGYKSGGVDTQKYSIVVLFKKNAGTLDEYTDVDDESYSSSEDELEAEKDKLAASQAKEYIMHKEKIRRQREAAGKPTRRKILKKTDDDTRSDYSVS